MIREAALHRWCHPERLVLPAEVVISKPQGIRGLQVLPLLTKTVCQPGHAPHPHADTQVLPLHVASADAVTVRIAADEIRDCINNFGGAVPLLAFT